MKKKYRLIYSTNIIVASVLVQLNRRKRCQRGHQKSEFEMRLIKSISEFRSSRQIDNENLSLNKKLVTY